MWGFLHINKQRFAFSAPYFFCAVISVWALERLVKAIQKKGKKFISWGRLLRWGIILIFLINAGTGLYYYWRSELYQKDIYYNVYIADEAMRSLTYIDKMIPPLSKIMTTYYTGMFVPVFTTQKVFIGHDVSTLDFGTKWWYSNALFDGRLTPQEAKDLFVRYGIQYLYWDRGDIFEKYQPLVIELYRDGWMRVYKVR
jgi:hypothetical protein